MATTSSFIDSARQALVDRDYRQAEHYASFALKLDPADAFAWRIIVVSARGRGADEEALEAAEQGLRHVGEDPRLALQGGLAAIKLKLYHKSWSLLETAHALGVRSSDLLEPLAQSRYEIGDFKGTIDIIRQAMASGSVSPTMYGLYAYALSSQNKVSEAQNVCDIALQIHPDNMELLFCARAIGAAIKPQDIERVAARLAVAGLDPKEQSSLAMSLAYAGRSVGATTIAAYFAQYSRNAYRTGLTDPNDPISSAEQLERIVTAAMALPDTVLSEEPQSGPERDDPLDCIPIIILGPPRAGKTQLANCLQRFDSVLSVDESVLLEEIILSSYGELTPIDPRHATTQQRTKVRSWFNALARTSPDAQFLVFTRPSHNVLVGLIAAHLPEAKFLRVSRPREDVMTAQSEKFFWDGNLHVLDDQALARHVTATEALLDQWSRVLNTRCLTVPFQDGGRWDENTIHKVSRFLGFAMDGEVSPPPVAPDHPVSASVRNLIDSLPNIVDCHKRAEKAAAAGHWQDPALIEARELAPGCMRTWTLLADALKTAGRLDESLNTYCEVLEIVNFDTDAVHTYDGLRAVMGLIPGEAALLALHEDIKETLQRYRKQSSVHFGDYAMPYQSCERIRLPGNRRTAQRLKAYDLDSVGRVADMTVLDIGCHTGFLGIELAVSGADVEAFDSEAPAVDVANRVAQFLKLPNYSASSVLFDDFSPSPTGYDLILSCAVHSWIGIDAPSYGARLHQWLRPDGFLLVESQGVRTEGAVEPGFKDYVDHIKTTGFTEIRWGEVRDDGKTTRLFCIMRKE